MTSRDQPHWYHEEISKKRARSEEKTFNTAEAYSDMTEYGYQQLACKQFFQDQLPCLNSYPLAQEDIPSSMEQYKQRPFYDITGFDAHQVVAVLSAIVNDRDQFTKNMTFYLLIRGSQEYTSQAGLEEVFSSDSHLSLQNINLVMPL